MCKFNSYSEPPQNVTLTATGHDELKFHWSPPPEFAATLYVVFFQEETYHISPPTNLVMELDSLMPYTAYTCCVAANTTFGPSSIVCATQTTLETGMQKLLGIPRVCVPTQLWTELIYFLKPQALYHAESSIRR